MHGIWLYPLPDRCMKINVDRMTQLELIFHPVLYTSTCIKTPLLNKEECPGDLGTACIIGFSYITYKVPSTENKEII